MSNLSNERRATKTIRGLGKLSYGERSTRRGLKSFKKRKSRRDMIEAYKTMTGKEAISAHEFFEISRPYGKQN